MHQAARVSFWNYGKEKNEETKNFDYTASADQTGLFDPNLPTNRKSCVIKRTHT